MHNPRTGCADFRERLTRLTRVGGAGVTVTIRQERSSDEAGLGPRVRGPTSRSTASAGPFGGARERGGEGVLRSPGAGNSRARARAGALRACPRAGRRARICRRPNPRGAGGEVARRSDRRLHWGRKRTYVRPGGWPGLARIGGSAHSDGHSSSRQRTVMIFQESEYRPYDFANRRHIGPSTSDIAEMLAVWGRRASMR